VIWGDDLCERRFVGVIYHAVYGVCDGVCMQWDILVGYCGDEGFVMECIRICGCQTLFS